MDHLIKGTVNPLSFIAVDYDGADPTLEEVLKFLCPPAVSSDVESLIQRYQAIGPPPHALAVVPAEPEILKKNPLAATASKSVLCDRELPCRNRSLWDGCRDGGDFPVGA